MASVGKEKVQTNPRWSFTPGGPSFTATTSSSDTATNFMKTADAAMTIKVLQRA